MKVIDTTAAVGHVLCHDVTQIIRGVSKGARFRKGHVIREEDIPVLLSLGKDHIYVWEKNSGMLHENEAAEILRQLCGTENLQASAVKEGKIELKAACDGLFKVDVSRLTAVNSLGEIMIATRHNNTPVKAGDVLAGMRVIPLVIEAEKLRQAGKVSGAEPLLRLLPYRPMKVGVVTTGNEVFYGRIKDTFTPVIEQKLEQFGFKMAKHEIVEDSVAAIHEAVLRMLATGMDMILCTGGMSVDPDDLTPAAIRATGADFVTYGVPVLPGAMLLLAYYQGRVPILGLPGCVMYAATTVFDLVLPRLAAGEKIRAQELAGLGHGGLCLGCSVCRYPACSFGKGI